MSTLWGDEQETKRTAKKKPQQKAANTGIRIKNSCAYYGHAWQYYGITGLKRCTLCLVNGYCPDCTPVAPLKDAKPFYCEKHAAS